MTWARPAALQNINLKMIICSWHSFAIPECLNNVMNNETLKLVKTELRFPDCSKIDRDDRMVLITVHLTASFTVIHFKCGTIELPVVSEKTVVSATFIV